MKVTIRCATCGFRASYEVARGVECPITPEEWEHGVRGRHTLKACAGTLTKVVRQ